MKKTLKKETAYKTDYIIESIDSEPEEDKTYKSSYREFDPNENVLIDETYLSDGTVDRKYEYQYKGNKLVDEKLYYGGDELSEHISYEYDGEYLVKKYVHYQDETKDVIHHEYDDNGNLIRKTTVNNDGETEETEIMEYEADRVVSYSVYEDEEDSPSVIERWTYDENGEVTDYYNYDEFEGYITTVKSSYDENGRLYQTKGYRDGKLKEKVGYKRREDDGKPEEIIEEQPGVKTRVKLEYDNKGNVIGQHMYDRYDNLISRIKRKYDENGNLVESDVLSDPQGLGDYERYKIRIELEYYEG